ncbi:MAG: hypothetical protein ABI969_00200 [bacterium]
MRKLLLAGLLLAGACKTRTIDEPATAPAPVLSASKAAIGPRPAVDAFLSAIKAQDLQALSVAWGDKTGPVRDSKVFSREEMEQRGIYLLRCFRHDRTRVLGESAAAGGERNFQVELMRGTVTRVADFLVVQGPDRWYVRTANMDAVKDLCAAR